MCVFILKKKMSGEDFLNVLCGMLQRPYIREMMHSALNL